MQGWYTQFTEYEVSAPVTDVNAGSFKFSPWLTLHTCYPLMLYSSYVSSGDRSVFTSTAYPILELTHRQQTVKEHVLGEVSA